jgi:capsular exopolysaccharide synthesis family protein
MYTEHYYEVKDINERLATLQKISIGKEVSIKDMPEMQKWVKLAEDTRKAQQEVNNLFDTFDDAQLRAWRVGEGYETLKDIEEEIRRCETIIRTLTDDIRKIETTIETTPSNVFVLQRPTEPQTAISPSPTKFIGFSIFIFFVLTGFLVYMAEYLDTTLRSADDLQLYTNMDVLSIIPHISIYPAEEEKRPFIWSPDKKLMQYADAFRILKTNILFAIPQVANPVIVISSSLPEEGKSFVAANLACAFAEDERKTLLASCDMRRPVIHEMLKTKKAPGMVDVLEGKIDWQKCVQTTQISNLDFIPSGTATSKSSSLIAKPAFDEFLKQIKEVYDVIIMDSPSTLLVTDASIIASKVDAAILVYAVIKTEKRAIKRAINTLVKVKRNLIGLVANFTIAEVAYYRKYYKTYYSSK